MLKYNISNDGKTEYVKEYSLPILTQGIAFTEYNEEEYLVTTNSYSDYIHKLSVLKYNKELDIYEKIGVKDTDKQLKLEGIKIDKYGNIVSISEHKDCSQVYITTIEELLKDIEPEEETPLIEKILSEIYKLTK